MRQWDKWVVAGLTLFLLLGVYFWDTVYAMYMTGSWWQWLNDVL